MNPYQQGWINGMSATPPDYPVYRFTYSPGEADEPAASIIEAVAWIKTTQVSGLDQLSEALDPDALNALLGTRRAGDGPATEHELNLMVRFVYEGCVIEVTRGAFTVEKAERTS